LYHKVTNGVILSNSSQIWSTNEGWCVIINIKNEQHELSVCLVTETKYD